MRTNAQKTIILTVIVVATLLIVAGAYLYLQSKRTASSFTKNNDLLIRYRILRDENLWRMKLIDSNIPMQWDITEKNIVVKEIRQNEFLCGNSEAQLTNYSSYNNGSIGGWNNISVVDCRDYYYFIYEFGDAGPKLYGPFDKEK